MPSAVLWDVGNVMVRWNPRALYAKIFPDPAECDRFLAEICTMAWHARTDMGVPFADNCAALAEQHPRYAAEIAAWQTRWWEMFSGPIPETEAAIAELHALGVKQYALTNMSHETVEGTFAMSPAFGLLDGRIVSGHEGVMKPGAEIFQLTCERFGLAPADALFVDDSASNIATARGLGFHTLHFTDPAELRPTLARLGLI